MELPQAAHLALSMRPHRHNTPEPDKIIPLAVRNRVTARRSLVTTKPP
jgi:hypothetical protein